MGIPEARSDDLQTSTVTTRIRPVSNVQVEDQRLPLTTRFQGSTLTSPSFAVSPIGAVQLPSSRPFQALPTPISGRRPFSWLARERCLKDTVQLPLSRPFRALSNILSIFDAEGRDTASIPKTVVRIFLQAISNSTVGESASTTLSKAILELVSDSHNRLCTPEWTLDLNSNLFKPPSQQSLVETNQSNNRSKKKITNSACGIGAINAFELPLLITVLLSASGVTITHLPNA